MQMQQTCWQEQCRGPRGTTPTGKHQTQRPDDDHSDDDDDADVDDHDDPNLKRDVDLLNDSAVMCYEHSMYVYKCNAEDPEAQPPKANPRPIALVQHLAHTKNDDDDDDDDEYDDDDDDDDDDIGLKL